MEIPTTEQNKEKRMKRKELINNEDKYINNGGEHLQKMLAWLAAERAEA